MSEGEEEGERVQEERVQEERHLPLNKASDGSVCVKAMGTQWCQQINM